MDYRVPQSVIVAIGQSRLEQNIGLEDFKIGKVAIAL